MAKILITREGVLERTVQLTKERMTLGRHRHNDIVLEHPAVSGEHAAIVTILDDSFLEDAFSTNGTFVNGHRIDRHLLQNKDIIKLARYRIEFVADGIRPLSGAALAPVPQAIAYIEVLNGGNAGKRLELAKAQSSFGRAGVQVVSVTRSDTAYFAAHTDGERITLLNGLPLGSEPQPLIDGDVLDLSGTQMAFRFG